MLSQEWATFLFSNAQNWHWTIWICVNKWGNRLARQMVARLWSKDLISTCWRGMRLLSIQCFIYCLRSCSLSYKLTSQVSYSFWLKWRIFLEWRLIWLTQDYQNVNLTKNTSLKVLSTVKFSSTWIAWDVQFRHQPAYSEWLNNPAKLYMIQPCRQAARSTACNSLPNSASWMVKMASLRSSSNKELRKTCTSSPLYSREAIF